MKNSYQENNQSSISVYSNINESCIICILHVTDRSSGRFTGIACDLGHVTGAAYGISLMYAVNIHV